MKLTDPAKAKVLELITSNKIIMPEHDIFLRIAVQPGGCSGLRYQTYFDFDKKYEDHLIRYQDFDVRVDKMSWPYLEESTMDYINTIEKQGFTIDNPNAQGGCACGDSFH
jgi:iron-sulfur cluster assembly accessory protein